MKSARHILIVLLILLAPLFSIVADSPKDLLHIIAYYSFDVKGSSSERILRDMIVPPGGDAPYASVGAMERALDAKRSKLNNMRVFEEVSYTYEAVHADDIAIRYRVKFFVDDAFSFLAVPYPKYDSNYGFMVGVKAYDKNLFGSFADLYYVINATQRANSWEDWDWFSEISIKNIPIGDSTMNLGAEFEAILEEAELRDIVYSGYIDWRGVPLAQTTFDFHVDIDENDETENEFDKLLTTSVQWNNLPWFNSALQVRPAFQFRQDGDFASWAIDNASFYSSVNPIRINGEEYVFANTMKLKFPHEYVQSTTSFTLADASFLGMQISFWVSADNYFDMKKQEFYNNTYTTGTSLGFSLPLSISYSGAYSVSLRDGFDLSTTTTNHVPVLSTTQSLSFGRINWAGNFRKGIQGSLWGKADYALFSRDLQNLDYLSYAVQGEVSAHVKLGSRIGLSTQAMGFYAHVPSFDWYEDQSFPEFLPNRTISASGNIRGILDKTFESVVGDQDYQKLGAIANFDATLMFIKFKGFAEGFMSAFMDIGVFTPTVGTSSGSNTVSLDDLIVFKTVGIEGYGIMDKFPSYPIRGSLGFNLDDVVSHFRGDLAFSDIEFELTIGMGLHY